MENNQTKKCINENCNKTKPINEFCVNKARPDGINDICKTCASEKLDLYKKSKDGIVTAIFNSQLQKSKERGHIPPSYTRQELTIWVFRQDLFHSLYIDWVDSGYKKDLKPSVDRLNDYIGYSFDNIRLVTWLENRLKQSKDILLARSTSGDANCRAILQFDKNGNFINEFVSLNEAGRVLNISSGHISCVCAGRRNTCGGFKWAYKN